ncbi:MAG: PEP-CTERM sorting domain-containing protein [Opitutaceae bacterium]|nr:PEP-CTERM sorting domain-containing protein [Opitutaceae bacterium]
MAESGMCSSSSMQRLLKFSLAVLIGASTGFGQMTFTITGTDGSNLVTVTASGSFTATSGLDISNGVQSWNSYGDFVQAAPPSNFFNLNLGSGITLTNQTSSTSTPLVNIGFLNTVSSGDAFSITVNPGIMLNPDDFFLVSGSAVALLSVSFDLFDYFNGPGTFTTAATLNPFGTGPTVIIIDSAAVPEPSTYALLLGIAGLFAVILWRRKPTPIVTA